MNYLAYYYKGTGPRWWALRHYMIENRDKYFLLGLEPTGRHYLTSAQFKSEYLDIKGIRENENIPVERGTYLNAGANALVYGSLGTMFFAIVLKGNSNPRMVKAVKKALEDLGFTVEDDKDSVQSNDLVVNGEKVFGVAKDKIAEDRVVYSFFVNLSLDKRSLSYIHQPVEKFEGKPVETIEERISGGLRNIKPELTFNEVYEAIKENVAQEFDELDGYEEKNIEGIDWQKVDEIEKYLTSDEYIYSV